MTELLELLKPGMTVVDIGANVGSYTTSFLTAVGPTGRVYAIEPALHTLPYLYAAAPGAFIIQAAVCDHEGIVTLYHSNESPHHSLYRQNLVQDMNTSEVVRAVTLDKLIARGELPPQINAVKIDAQGAEMAILRGAACLLAEHLTWWYLELWPDGLKEAGSSAEAVCDLLTDAGYVPIGTTWDHIRQAAKQTTGQSAMDILVKAA